MHFITMDTSKCVVCRNCEYACSYVQEGDFSRHHSNIRVTYYADAKICLPLTCMHCEQAWCKEVCPASAITRNEFSQAIEIDQNLCVGCKMCILCCPLGNIHFDEEAKVSRKCDLCQGEPECVKHCISGALSLVDPEHSCQNNRLIFRKFLQSMADTIDRNSKLEK